MCGGDRWPAVCCVVVALVPYYYLSPRVTQGARSRRPRGPRQEITKIFPHATSVILQSRESNRRRTEKQFCKLNVVRIVVLCAI